MIFHIIMSLKWYNEVKSINDNHEIPTPKSSIWGKWAEIVENKMFSDKLRVHTDTTAGLHIQ